MTYRSLLSLATLAGIASVLAGIQGTPRHQAWAQTPKAQAFHLNERIRIDGKLDKPAWKAATPIGDLIQVLPKAGGQPSERTDVRVLVDSEALYFGVTCYDRKPSAIIAAQLMRDAELDVDDYISSYDRGTVKLQYTLRF